MSTLNSNICARVTKLSESYTELQYISKFQSNVILMSRKSVWVMLVTVKRISIAVTAFVKLSTLGFFPAIDWFDTYLYVNKYVLNDSSCIFSVIISLTLSGWWNNSHTLAFIFSFTIKFLHDFQSPIFMAFDAATTCSLMLSGGPTKGCRSLTRITWWKFLLIILLRASNSCAKSHKCVSLQ